MVIRQGSPFLCKNPGPAHHLASISRDGWVVIYFVGHNSEVIFLFACDFETGFYTIAQASVELMAIHLPQFPDALLLYHPSSSYSWAVVCSQGGFCTPTIIFYYKVFLTHLASLLTQPWHCHFKEFDVEAEGWT